MGVPWQVEIFTNDYLLVDERCFGNRDGVGGLYTCYKQYGCFIHRVD
jgi:hypothetical protein